MKIKINNNYTYETDEQASVGDTAILPSPSWLADVQGATWEGEVTATESDYDGWCAKAIKIVKQ